jgi:aryl-alcohol dehydrogenase-like predicted oxidoreductase
MEHRLLGRTGLKVSVLGFGCGFVGGLIARGTLHERKGAVARALDLGINYFDTAPFYGDSEEHLGETLAALRRQGSAIVGTKVMVSPAQPDSFREAITASVQASLRRLRTEHIELLQLHNCVGLGHVAAMRPYSLEPRQVLNEVLPVFQDLRKRGLVRHLGFSGVGSTGALHEVIASGGFDTVQAVYNLLNPSGEEALPAGSVAQDYQRLLHACERHGVGVIAIRILAGGALSGTAQRHPVANPTVDPLGSGASYDDDVRSGQGFLALVRDGHSASLVEAAVRYAIASPRIATALVGISSLEQLEEAGAALARGPLDAAALRAVADLRAQLA